MWRAMGELWASYGRAMGELWATIARHIFTTLTLTMACGTIYAPLELSICTTMSMNGKVPRFDFNIENWTFRQNELSPREDAVVHILIHRPGSRKVTVAQY